jgi:hypothetical protein
MKTVADWLQDPATFTTPLLTILTDKFTTDFLEWDPLTINIEIKENFGVEPSEELLNKIQAGSSLFTTNLFYLSPETFGIICNTLNRGPTSSELFIPADLEDVMWGVAEAKLLAGDLGDNKFSHSIARYVGYLLQEEGIYKPPSILSFAEYDEQQEARLQDNFTAEDPLLYTAFWDKQASQRDELERVNKLKFDEFFKQLSGLPVQLDKAFVEQATAVTAQGLALS